MSNKEPNILTKIFRFFFPKDFAGSLSAGMQIGAKKREEIKARRKAHKEKGRK